MKIAICAGVGIIATYLVYYGLQDSLSRPSISRIPLPSHIAVSIVSNLVQNKENSTSIDPDNLSARYVYIRGNGNVFVSDPNSNTIGKYLGAIGEPTTTTGNHFAWEVLDKRNNASYFVDSITGEIVSHS